MEENNRQWVLGLFAGGVAGVLQLSSILTQDHIPEHRKIIAAVVIASCVGVGAALLLYTQLHWPIAAAGIVGAGTGFIPGARWVSVANAALEQQMRERLKVELQQQTATPTPPQPIDVSFPETPAGTAEGGSNDTRS